MIRNAVTSDRKAVYDMQNSRVSLEKNEAQEFYFARLLRINQVVVNEIADRVRASLQVNQHSIILDGKRLAVGTIIAPMFATGYQEALEQLLEDVLDEQSRKTLVTMISADRPSLYRQYGFEEVYKKRLYTIRSSDLKNASYKGVSRDFTIGDLQQIYGKFTSHFNGYYLRDNQYWLDLYKQLEFLRCNLCVYRNDEGEIEGYMIYHLQPEKICVDEILYLNGEAFIRLLCYGFRYKDEMELTVSQDEEIRRLIPDIKYRSVNTFMARINDFELFSRLFESRVETSIDGFYRSGKPLFLNEWC
ncbi:MAG: GNAT family N-acetyltransferase [Erysipelotrichaceae bacterium]|nr:GNAT family N-acetyltransferase [Erysipelotrichaceae bacterium]